MAEPYMRMNSSDLYLCIEKSPEVFLRDTEGVSHSPASTFVALLYKVQSQEKQPYSLLYGSVLVFNNPSCCQITSCVRSGTISFIVAFHKPIALRGWHELNCKVNNFEKANFQKLSHDNPL